MGGCWDTEKVPFTLDAFILSLGVRSNWTLPLCVVVAFSHVVTINGDSVLGVLSRLTVGHSFLVRELPGWPRFEFATLVYQGYRA